MNVKKYLLNISSSLNKLQVSILFFNFNVYFWLLSCCMTLLLFLSHPVPSDSGKALMSFAFYIPRSFIAARIFDPLRPVSISIRDFSVVCGLHFLQFASGDHKSNFPAGSWWHETWPENIRQCLLTVRQNLGQGSIENFISHMTPPGDIIDTAWYTHTLFAYFSLFICVHCLQLNWKWLYISLSCHLNTKRV